ncbi:hypothetical protein GC175_28825 [bacterium]|nr:hypothetical protein [bacterium]
MEKGREEERREGVGPQLESALISVWDASDNSLCGSGLVIRSDGYVATCAHVVACAVGQSHTLATAPNEQVSLRFLKSGEKVLARVVAWSPWHEHDLAVLQVEDGLPSGCTAMDMFDAPVEFGQEFRSYGFPKRGGYELGRWAYGTFQHPMVVPNVKTKNQQK